MDRFHGIESQECLDLLRKKAGARRRPGRSILRGAVISGCTAGCAVLACEVLSLPSYTIYGAIWMASFLSAVVIAALERRDERAALAALLFTMPDRCCKCGYNLIGLDSSRCPECGQVLVDGEIATETKTTA